MAWSSAEKPALPHPTASLDTPEHLKAERSFRREGHGERPLTMHLAAPPCPGISGERDADTGRALKG